MTKNPLHPQQSVATSLNPDPNAPMTMAEGDDSSIGNLRDPSLSPTAKSRGTTPVPRAKTAVTFGTNTVAPAPPSTNAATVAPAIPIISNRSKQRPFRSILYNDKTSGITRQWVTREIAALEFLQMGIPMAREGSIVHEGWTRQHQTSDQHQDKTHWLDQSRELREFSNTNPLEDNAKKNETKEQDDEILQISPSLLPLERSHTSPDPTVARQGRWWEKWIVGQSASGPNQQQQQHQSKGVNVSRDSQIEDLEEPDEPQQQQQQTSQPYPTTPQQQPTLPSAAAATIYAPGRRLEGDPATKVQIPLANTLQNNQGGPGLGVGSTSHQRQRQNSDVVSLQLTKHQSIARLAISREWELRVAHGLNARHHQHHDQPSQHHRHHNPAMLDGRMYMSAKESYPMMVFSLLRYEPKKEEALRRRQKLEERGGGGTQFFIMPSRDWRGISFRALLPVTTHKNDLSSKTNHRDGTNSTDVRGESGSTMDKRRGLLFDRFAAKRTGSKENFSYADAKEEGGDISIIDRNPLDPSKKDGDGDNEDIDMDMDSDDDEEMGDDTYVAGLLDDPGMVQGRHRNVMIGDRGTGPIVSSTIQFVKPKLLKADLNQQFRERFDGYEPPISQRKFIGAKVVDGIYTLMDPTKEKGIDDDEGSSSRKNEDDDDTTVGTSVTPTTGATSSNSRSHRRRQGSTSSISLSTVGGSSSIDGGTGEGQETIRMPPSLTLSKIRSLKQQALAAAVRAKLEISTVALAIVYFERLCLDCRVDKSNRRLSFAACLLLAIKINEAHVGVIATKAVSNPPSSKKARASQKIQSLIRSSKKSSTMFASLLEFFTQEWNISLKHLFAAEWGVFAALQFRLKAKPSDVAFHFRRLMKSLGYDPRRYLGAQAYGYWQQALAEEEFRRQEWEARIQSKRERKEKKKLKQLQREIEEAADRGGDHISDGESVGEKNDGESNHIDTNDAIGEESEIQPRSPLNTMTRRRIGLGDIFKTRAGGVPKRSVSTERSWTRRRGSGETESSVGKVAPTSTVAIGMPKQRPRPPLLRPLSKSKSMLSLSAKSGALDEMSESKKSEIILDDLEEENDGRQRDKLVVDDDEGIVI